MHTHTSVTSKLDKISNLATEIARLETKAKHEESLRLLEAVSVLHELVERSMTSLGLVSKELGPGHGARGIRVASLVKRDYLRRSTVEHEECPDGLYLLSKGTFAEVMVSLSKFGETKIFCQHITVEQVAQHYDSDEIATGLIRAFEERRDQLSGKIRKISPLPEVKLEASA